LDLATSEDLYVHELQDERRVAVWVAGLASGLTVYADDDRPGLERSAWLRLRRHCRETGDRVTSLRVKFRDHWEGTLPAGADGYFFHKAATCSLGSKDIQYYFLIGALTNGTVLVQKYKVPELLLFEVSSRPEVGCEHGLIR
jgi:hypothetical protein